MIVCCGESLIDMLPRQLDTGETAYLPVVGGAVFNTAIALGRLGEAVGFFSGISTDPFGVQLTEALTASNVDSTMAIRSPKPTTLAFVALVDGHAQYRFYDEGSAGRMITSSQLPNLSAIDAAHFGAISLIGEPCGSAYQALAERLSTDTLISLDPNIRPAFISDEPSYRNRINAMLKISDIIKISEEDVDWLSPGRSFHDFAAEWIEKGTSLVIGTKGADGAVAITEKKSIEIAAKPAKVVDTVGAGDTFNAGLLSGLRQAGYLEKGALRSLPDHALKGALDLAAMVAAVTVSRAGANPPWKSEIG